MTIVLHQDFELRKSVADSYIYFPGTCTDFGDYQLCGVCILIGDTCVCEILQEFLYGRGVFDIHAPCETH